MALPHRPSILLLVLTACGTPSGLPDDPTSFGADQTAGGKSVEVCNDIDDNGDGFIDNVLGFVRVGYGGGPNNYPTISQGLAAAASGQTICVHAGIYVEASGIELDGVNIAAKSVTIQGASGSADTIVSSGSSTALEASGSGGDSCFEFVDAGTTTYSITLKGLTLRGCRAVEDSSGSNDDCASGNDDNCNDGGGINVAPGSGVDVLTLRDVVIYDNASGDDGGGIYLGDADGDFQDILVYDNVADGTGSAENTGGGIRAATTGSHSLDILDSSITDNAAVDSPTGGGLSERGYTVTLDGVRVSRNEAVGGAGGGIHLFGGELDATDSEIGYNDAGSGDGGGIAVVKNGATLVSLDNTRVVGNSSGTGGGAWVDGGTVTCTGVSFGTPDLGFTENSSLSHGAAVYLAVPSSGSSVFTGTTCDMGVGALINDVGGADADVYAEGAATTYNFGSNASPSCTQAGC